MSDANRIADDRYAATRQAAKDSFSKQLPKKITIWLPNVEIMSIYDYLSYKDFVRAWVSSQAQRGRGAYRRMANHLRVSTTMMSQVFSGDKNISLEMAAELSDFLGLDRREERYFFLLVELERAGSARLRQRIRALIDELREESRKIVERVARDIELNSEDKAIYYSSWLYTGVRNLLAIPEVQSVDAVANALLISPSQVRLIVQFLIDRGLVRESEGRLEVAAKATHISSDHPLVAKHHQNWRLRGFQKMDIKAPNDLFYTAPMSLSVNDAEKVRQFLVDLVQRVNRVVVESPSETVQCLNIDWYQY